MAVNKVIYDGETLIDLTSDTVASDSLAKGTTAHDKTGAEIIGTLDFESLQNQITEVDERLTALEHMTLQNLFTVPVAIDSTGTTLLADDLGNAIVADWKYKEE